MRRVLIFFLCLDSGPNDDSLYIDQNTRIQILDSIDMLPQAEKDQCGAFIVSIHSLLP